MPESFSETAELRCGNARTLIGGLAYSLRLAIAGEPAWVVDARETHRSGPSYTVDTLAELRAELGAEVPLVLLLGSVTLSCLAT